MATTAPARPFSSLPRCSRRRSNHPPQPIRLRAAASDSASGEPSSGKETKRKPRVDTRIHWSNPDEGWIGENSGKADAAGANKEEPFGQRFADLIKQSTESHYQFMGIPEEADSEEIKAAYRRLSKEYHPDTTVLPLKSASEKFIRLREAYKVLGNEESRKFYDWTLAQEAESRRLMQMRMQLEDPFEQDIDNYKPVPDMVDRLGGRNMKLSDQAMTALTIDVAVIIICIFAIIFAVLFKQY